jgi:hypothetical protein
LLFCPLLFCPLLISIHAQRCARTLSQSSNTVQSLELDSFKLAVAVWEVCY